MRVPLKPLAAAILRPFSVCCGERVCLFKMSVRVAPVYEKARVSYLLLVAVRAPVTSAHPPRLPTWLPAKLEELIGIRILFLKGRSFSVGAEC